MAKHTKLSARTVATAKPGRYGDGRGLWLAVSPSGARKWVFRFTCGGRVTEMGLGNAAVSLAMASNKADEARKLVASGINPIAARREARRMAAGKLTFGECASALIAAKEAEWRNTKHRAQWRSTLETYCAAIWGKPVDEVDTGTVLSVLQPIWQDKAETASRLRGRIEAVLDSAKAQGHRNGENPARWRGYLDKLLAKRGRLTRGHHSAMPYDDIPAFMAELRRREAAAALALEFTILTAGRTGEVLGAKWDEIDFEAGVWTVPATRMKAAKKHRVPLSKRAVAIPEKLATAKTGEFVFPGNKRGPLSSMSMVMLLRRMGHGDITVHGFRSAFRDWAGDQTSFPREVAEAELAHVAGDATERAYRRSDALEKRRELMEA
jgi:integrase